MLDNQTSLHRFCPFRLRLSKAKTIMRREVHFRSEHPLQRNGWMLIGSAWEPIHVRDKLKRWVRTPLSHDVKATCPASPVLQEWSREKKHFISNAVVEPSRVVLLLWVGKISVVLLERTHTSVTRVVAICGSSAYIVRRASIFKSWKDQCLR